jgi:hypothetical protein
MPEQLLQAQPGPIEKGHDHPHRPLDILEDLADFFSAEYDWDPMRQLGPGHLFDCASLDAKHVTIEKQQGAQRARNHGGQSRPAARRPGLNRPVGDWRLANEDCAELRLSTGDWCTIAASSDPNRRSAVDNPCNRQSPIGTRE